MYIFTCWSVIDDSSLLKILLLAILDFQWYQMNFPLHSILVTFPFTKCHSTMYLGRC